MQQVCNYLGVQLIGKKILLEESKMKNLKTSIVLTLVLAMGTSFVGCGGGGSTPAVGASGTFSFTSANSASITTGTTRAIDVDATDPDGNAIVYALSGVDAAKFSVDANGLVSFNAEPTAGTYSFTVTATAGSKSITQDITVTVTAPVNHAPVISSVAVASVNENQNSAIDVDATDADSDTLTYSLEGGADAADVSINPNSGVVSFNTAPDFETKNSYSFTVGVNDGVVTVSQNVTITILDVAEGTAPVITTANAISVDENQKSAVNIDATDVDGDVITYSLEGGADDASFDINATTGIVTFKNTPDYETKNSYSIIAGASDATDTTTKNIIISINDLVGGSKVVKTGQSISYTPNDDGSYQSGLDRSFTKEGSFDTIWGIIINDTRVVIDNATNLEWKDTYYPISDNYNNAATYCNNLDFNSKTDWRLPTINELYTISDRGANNPAIFGNFDNTYIDKRYWSSTDYKRSANKHYTLGFDTGNDYTSSDNQERYVRCVRKDFVFWNPFFIRFSRANNVVSDRTTQLQWWDPTLITFVPGVFVPLPLPGHFEPPHIDYVGAAAQTGTFAQAIAGCESLSVDGKSDWRLPNINELLTLVNRYKSSGVAFYDDFKSNTTGLYFSSTTRADDTTKAWIVNFSDGQDVIGTAKTNTRQYRCVRTMGD
jgi:hypothetical protein